eukprot:scaffold11375_cov123-Isochrysis_galbana.AAC.2
MGPTLCGAPESQHFTTNRRKASNSLQEGVYLSSRLQIISPPHDPRVFDSSSLQKHAPHHTPSAHPSGAEKLPLQTAHDHLFEFKRQTVSQHPTLPYATRSKTLNLTFPPPTHPQKSVNNTPPKPPPTGDGFEEAGGDPEFVSDTNNMITIKQKGPTLHEIRDSDMGATHVYDK